MKSLRTLESRNKAGMRNLIADIADYVEQGNPLWQAMDRHGEYFTPVDVNLVKAAEASGNLVPVLQRLVAYRERRELLMRRVRGAMLYPIILLLAAAGVFALITGYIIPQFASMYERLGQDLPAYTKFVMGLSEFIAFAWWIILLVILGLVVAYYVIRGSSRRWRMRLDRWKLKVPVVGKIWRKLAVVEMCRSLALLLKSGLSMLPTLDLTRHTVNNAAVGHVIENVRDSVERGAGIEPPMREEPGLIPPVVTDMLVTGEESGQIDRIADQIADTYQEEVNIDVSTIGEALVPIVTVIIGVIVGFLAVAMFWPLITMVQNLGSQGF
jgi:type IV pilus assembly protein PilC